MAAAVVLTTIHDDAVGGDTAKDGPTTGSPGDWRGMFFASNSDASNLQGTTIRFGGAANSAAVDANIYNAVDPFFVVTAFLVGVRTTVTLPSDQSLVGFPFGLQTLALRFSNIGTGNWTPAFYGTLVE